MFLSMLCVFLFGGPVDTPAKTSPKAPDVQESLVVTGQFRPASLMSSVVGLKVISRQDIEARGAADLRELLAHELQIDLDHHSVFGTSLRIGGISGENLKLLIDGAPMIGRLDGIIDLEHVPLAQIERIEIIQGPMSVYYGTDAFAGVVNLITTRPGTEKLTAEAQADWRSHGDKRLDVSAGMGWNDTALQVAVGRRDFDGYDPDPATRAEPWPDRTQDTASLQLSHHFANLSGRYRGSYASEELLELAQPTNSVYWDHIYVTDRNDHQLNLSGSLNEQLYLDVQVGHEDYDRTRDDYALSGGVETGVVQRDPQFETGFTHQFAKALFSYQGLIRNTELQLGFHWNTDRGRGGRLSPELAPLEEEAMILGLKWSGPWSLEVQPTVRMAAHNRYDVPSLPALHVHQRTRFLDWRAGYSEGFRGPSIKQLYLDFSMAAGPNFYTILGNPDLAPESGDAWTFSFEKPLLKGDNTLALTGSFLASHTENLIELSAAIPNPTRPNRFTRQYINVSEQRNQTATLGLECRLNAHRVALGAGQNAYWNVLAGTTLPQYNRSWDAHLEAETQFLPSLSGHLNFAYNGSRPGYVLVGRPATLREVKQEAWENLDVLARWTTPFQGWSLQAGVRNLLDVTQKDTVYTTTGAAHTSQQLDWGRTYQLLARFKMTP